MVRTALLTLWMFAMSAPLALANDGGEGTYGPADDKVVTSAAFIIIGGFPVLVAVLSILYTITERRRLVRLAAAKARTARADQRGGW
ncbi:hypothetical protein [Solirubrobacter soli]|uniref:hypothetical protein n=1 Tax=Solirubrobacter soli TaxID=363832 RepID=UPI000560E2EF|nr:hypothetical protein [Solirubrobacter soli]